MDRLKNKIVLITGGTSGIGLAAARLFAAEGAKVTVTGSNAKKLEPAKKELNGVAEVVLSDTGSSAEVKALAARFSGAGKGLDVLFLNAGIGKFGPITELDEEAFDESFRVNVRGPWLMLKYFGPLLHKGGAVVVNSSINNQLGMPGSSAYAATKAAVRSLVRVAANEFAAAGVRVNAVSPGLTETPFHGKMGMNPDEVDAFRKKLRSDIPLGRLGTPDEIAKAALFLASDDSSFMTGDEIVVDGGMSRV